MLTVSRRLSLAAALLLTACSPCFGQAKPSSGPSSTVVYVSGNDLVLKASDGKLLNYTVPSGVKFASGGKQCSLADLHPGDKITAPVVTGFDPAIVSGIAVVKGKVYAVTPPDGVTLLLSEGVKELQVPTGTTFMVDGKPMKVSELKPDMMVEATVVTTAADATTASATSVPPLKGVLLVAKTAAADDMPSAGTNLPLFALLGGLMLILGSALLMLTAKPVRQV
jgi:hypothetical protein